MSKVFSHSDIYRIGGDEFVVILMGEDYEHREELEKAFLKQAAEASASAKEGWERINDSVGSATYGPEIDAEAEDVLIRADHLMYENKRQRKRKSK